MSTGRELGEDSSRLPDSSLTNSDGHGSTKVLLRRSLPLDVAEAALLGHTPQRRWQVHDESGTESEREDISGSTQRLSTSPVPGHVLCRFTT